MQNMNRISFIFSRGYRVIYRNRRIVNISYCKARRIAVGRIRRIDSHKSNRFAAKPIGIGNCNRSHMLRRDGYIQIMVAAISPSYFTVGIIHIGNVIIQINGCKTAAFLYGLVRNIRNHRRIVHGIHGKGCRIVIGKTARIGSGKGDRFSAVPVVIGRGNGGHMVGIDRNVQIRIAAIGPG